jgi:hypothetical protein
VQDEAIRGRKFDATTFPAVAFTREGEPSHGFSPDPAAPDTTCVATLKPPPFRIDPVQ